MARRGRPVKGGETMLNPVTVRFTRPMMEKIESIMAERIDGADKGQVIRELVAKGLEALEAERRSKQPKK
jgi:hypothetical protein